MPMTYLILLARGSGSLFLPAHVGSELGRSRGLSGTAAEFIGARSQSKTWGGHDPLGPPLSSRVPNYKQSALKTGHSSNLIPHVANSALKQGGKKNVRFIESFRLKKIFKIVKSNH